MLDDDYFNAMPDLETIATLLPQYEFVGVQGKGGMGIVFKARQTALDREVAIKVLPILRGGEGEAFAAQFITEARAMAKLIHPNIVAVFDFGQTEPGHLYYVMEFVEGTTVHRLIRQRQLDEAAARRLTIQLCAALEFAHARGTVHRDIKPANLIVARDGLLKVADFGLAMHQSTLTTAETPEYGTPDYVSAERLCEGQVVDHRTDIYSAGVVLHEMLTGYTPRAAQEQGVPVSVPPAYTPILARCLAEDPEQRYASAAELRVALMRLEAQAAAPPVQAPVHAGYRPPQAAAHTPVRRAGRGGEMGWAFAILALLGVLAWLFIKPKSGSSAAGSSSATMPAAVTPDTDSTGGDPSMESPSTTTPGSVQTSPAGTPTTIKVLRHLDVPAAAGPAYEVPPGEPGEVLRLKGHKGIVWGVFILADQRRVVSVADDGTRVWDVGTGKELVYMPVQSGTSRSAFSDDGKLLAQSGVNLMAQVWNLETGEIKQMLLPATAVRANVMRFAPGTHDLLIGCQGTGGGMYLWRTDQGSTPEAITGWKYGVRSLAFLDADHFVASSMEYLPNDKPGPRNSEAWIGALSARKVLVELKSKQLEGSNMRVSPDGTRLLVSMSSIRLLDLQSGAFMPAGFVQPVNFGSTVFLQRGRLLMQASFGEYVPLWEIQSGKEVARLTADAKVFSHLIVSKDERWAVSGGYPTAPAGQPVRNLPSDLVVWRLPDLAKLGTDEARRDQGRRMAVRFQDAQDPELAALREETLRESPVLTPQQIADQLVELDQKYLSAVQRTAATASAADKASLDGEVSRLTNHLPLPASDASETATLARLRGIYRQQLHQLEGAYNGAVLEFGYLFKQKAAALLLRRREAKDPEAEGRVEGLITELSRTRSLEQLLKLAATGKPDPAEGFAALVQTP